MRTINKKKLPGYIYYAFLFVFSVFETICVILKYCGYSFNKFGFNSDSPAWQDVYIYIFMYVTLLVLFLGFMAYEILNYHKDVGSKNTRINSAAMCLIYPILMIAINSTVRYNSYSHLDRYDYLAFVGGSVLLGSAAIIIVSLFIKLDKHPKLKTTFQSIALAALIVGFILFIVGENIFNILTVFRMIFICYLLGLIVDLAIVSCFLKQR